MSIHAKRWLTLWLTVCVCLSMLCLAPISASAATEIKNATTTLAMGDPVVMMEVSANASAASGTGYHLVSATWYDGSGNVETSTFKKGSYTLVIQLAADAGYVFAADAKGYINNSNAGITTERSGDGSSLKLTKSYTATIWKPQPVKHPGPETVKEGGWCSFVVSGLYVGSYEWFLESPEGLVVPVSAVDVQFPGVTQDGDGTSKIKLYNIPYEMNGWKVYCTEWSVDKLSFTNTRSTTITVTTDRPQPTEAPEETAAPTPEATAAPEGDGSAPDAQAEGGEGAAGGGENGEGGEDGEHVHQFPDVWTYDVQTHWHACTECGEILDQATHDMVWTVTREPSREQSGEEQGVCSICGYKAVRELPFDEEAALERDQPLFRYTLIGLGAALLLSIVILIVQAVRRASRRRY